MNRPRVLLADDHRMVTEGLKRLLSDDCDLVATVEDGHSLVAAAKKLRPDVIVVDITMRTLSIWVSGYYNGTRNNTVLDVSALQKREQDVIDYCLSHPEMVFMGAVKSVLGNNK